ncbi:hypothetical protein JCM10213_006391 [Rhodosporidiobolus nylandii]
MLAASVLVAAIAPLAALAAPTNDKWAAAAQGAETKLVAAATGTLKCPEGYTYGSVDNVAEFPARIKDISPVIDSFFDSDWEGFTVLNTTGRNNTPGALRSFSFGDVVPLTEELIYFVDTPVVVDRLWKGVGAKYKGDLPVVAEAFGANLSSWTEHFTLTPLCHNRATRFTWTASYCSTNDPVLEQLFTQAHTGPFAALHETYGNFTGCADL